MATAALDGPDRRVSIGRIFSRGFGTIAAHPFATLGVALVFGALPGLIVQAALQQALGSGSFSIASLGWFAGIDADMALAAVMEGALALTVVAHGEGRRADIVDTLPPALHRLGPLILLGLIVGYGSALGLVLLILPGLALYIAWWVAAPALVIERLGLGDALNRSRELTRGARWKVFGVELILLIATWIVGAAFLAGDFRLTGSFQLGALPTDARSLIVLFVTVVTSTISSVVYGVMHISCYIELREWKDGPAADALVEVFR
ncbi:MAG TPA: hypothetical protein VGF77_13185 [Allosphingosinicella sp.]|jgi:hypothetical protein